MTAISPQTRTRAKSLRKNQTDGERRLWSELRDLKKYHGLHVRRQSPIGPYVVDFVIPSKKLVIELDGQFHFTTAGISKDEKRDRWLATQGYRVFRITTGELAENLDGCVTHIMHELSLIE